jgi:hypothetical protein
MKKRDDDVVLICMRADAPNTVHGSIFHKVCAECGERVMVAPSGQALLKQHPKAKILCTACFRPTPGDIVQSAAKTMAEIRAEVRNAGPNLLEESQLMLPTFCMFCGAVLRGGATVHAPGCEITRIIKNATEEAKKEKKRAVPRRRKPRHD